MQVIKLSDAVQDLPRQVTEFVHGVPGSYLDIGQQAAQPQPQAESSTPEPAAGERSGCSLNRLSC